MPKSSRDIYQILRKKIVNLDLEPGSLLNELDLSKEFAMSRTPIRASLKMLEQDRLVVIVPRYGVQVAQVDFREMRSLFDMTKVLDPFAVKLACEKATDEDIAALEAIVAEIDRDLKMGKILDAIVLDEEFHRTVVRIPDNSWLGEQLERLHLHSQRLWLYARNKFNDKDIFTRTFKKIVEAFKEKDSAKAAKYAEEHIDDFVDSIKDSLL